MGLRTRVTLSNPLEVDDIQETAKFTNKNRREQVQICHSQNEMIRQFKHRRLRCSAISAMAASILKASTQRKCS